MIPDSLDGPNIIQGSLNVEEGSRSKGKGDALREEIHTISGFQDGEKEA